jgi:hypothetical protein
MHRLIPASLVKVGEESGIAKDGTDVVVRSIALDQIQDVLNQVAQAFFLKFWTAAAPVIVAVDLGTQFQAFHPPVDCGFR